MGAETRIKIGYGFCLTGLAIALLSLVPSIVPPDQVPWPVFVGTMVYMPGSFLVFFSAKGMERNRHFNTIRMVRLGFFAVIAILTARVIFYG